MLSYVIDVLLFFQKYSRGVLGETCDFGVAVKVLIVAKTFCRVYTAAPFKRRYISTTT